MSSQEGTFSVYQYNPQTFTPVFADPTIFVGESLAFIICPKSYSGPEIPYIHKFTEKPYSYVNLLKGLDWILLQHPDIVHISLGPGKIQDDDPINLALLMFYLMNIPVVVAAGNNGLGGEGTLQALATHPTIISVGATDKNRKILDISSRGQEHGPTVTVVTDGSSNSDTYPPSTSFAAPKVTGLVMYLTSYLNFLIAEICDLQKNEKWSSLINSPIIGALDTGYDSNLAFHDNLEKIYLKKEYSSIRMFRTDKEREWYTGYSLFLRACGIEKINPVSPDIIKRCLEISAKPIPGESILAMGAGYIDGECVDELLNGITPEQLTRLLFPNVLSDTRYTDLVQECNQKLGFLPNTKTLDALKNYIGAGHRLVVARVLEGDGPHGTTVLSNFSHIISRNRGTVVEIGDGNIEGEKMIDMTKSHQYM
ncbi:MAG: S8/S53 family peptidase [Methanomicrobiales archaeon]|nr:S8/S53 family peptidase [Methanomicrobiales archaeon]